MIKLDKLADAKAVLDQAKSKGAKGDGFDKLEQRLQKAGQEPLEASQIASEPQPKQPNILDSLKLDQAIKLAKKKTKDGSRRKPSVSIRIFWLKFPKNKGASDGLKGLAVGRVGKVSKVQEPPQAQIQELINLHSQGQLQEALRQAETLVQQFPSSSILHNIRGAALKQLGRLDASIEAYKKALTINPDNAEVYNNMGLTLKGQGKLEEAIKCYNKALVINPNFDKAYNNKGLTLQDQGKLEEAIKCYKKAISINAGFSDAFWNLSGTAENIRNLKNG